MQKLQGGKKRARETTNGAHADGAVGVKKKEDEESSAEESRIGTSRKRTIIDPFDAAGKKRKKRRKEADEIKEVSTNGTAQEVRQMVVGENMMDADGAMAGPTPTKRKKKKKKSLLPEGLGVVEHNSGPQSATADNTIVPQNQGSLTQTPLDTWESKEPLQQEFRDGAADAPETGI